MLLAPSADLVPNTLAYENQPLVKATGFREYDARWLFGPDINLLGVEALADAAPFADVATDYFFVCHCVTPPFPQRG